MKTVQVTSFYGVQITVPLDAEGRLRVETARSIFNRAIGNRHISVRLASGSDTYDAYRTTLEVIRLPREATYAEIKEALKTLLMLVEVKYGCECVVVRELI